MPPAYEVLLLNTAVPQIQAAQAGDTYVVPRDIAFSAALTLSAGTANGVPYLNGSKVVTTGSALTFDGVTFGATSNAGGAVLSLSTTSPNASARNWAVAANNQVYGDFAILQSNAIGGNPVAAGRLIYYIDPAGNSTWYPGGTRTMDLTSTGLGIGTSSPGVKLDVVGQGRVVYNTGATNTGDQSVVTVGATTSGAYASSYGAGLQFQVTNSGGGFAGSRVVSRLGADNNTANLVFQARNYGYADSMTLDSSGNLKLGGTADRATTAGTNHFDIFDGTAPVGTLANGISLYSSSGEAYVMDAAGNATLFSPHDAVTNEWIFRSKHTPTGKVLKIDVERLLKFVNDHFGLDAVHEFIED